MYDFHFDTHISIDCIPSCEIALCFNDLNTCQMFTIICFSNTQ
nr:MAG TPA: hypothetical protein [Caudoviricetes sp.]